MRIALYISTALLAATSSVANAGDNNGAGRSFEELTFEQVSYPSNASASDIGWPDYQLDLDYQYRDRDRGYRRHDVQNYRLDDNLRYMGPYEFRVDYQLDENRGYGYYRDDRGDSYRNRLRFDGYARRRTAHDVGQIVGDLVEDLLSSN